MNKLISVSKFYFVEEEIGWYDPEIKSLDARLQSFVNHAANDNNIEIDEIIKYAGLPEEVKSLIEYEVDSH